MIEKQEQIELWIVRSLDGELSAGEQLELDRELIRNPEARRMMDDYRAVDALSSAALASINEAESGPRPHVAVAPRVGRQAWRVRRLWLIPGAIAAALLALAIPRPMWGPAPVESPLVQRSEMLGWPESDAGDLIQPVSSRPSVRRATGRDVVGVIGEDGNIYWLEVERSRTVRLPHGSGGSASNRL